CGVEGPTDDPIVLARRARQQRNLLATLLLSQGVPMVLSGDEVGRTQGGNNNAYCQDNATSWFDWAASDDGLHAFTAGLIALRRAHPVFRRRRWFQGRPLRDTVDIAWLRPDGSEMTDDDWRSSSEACVAMFFNGDAITSPGPRGERVVDDSFLLLVNASPEPRKWTISGTWGDAWRAVFDTASGDAPQGNGGGRRQRPRERRRRRRGGPGRAGGHRPLGGAPPPGGCPDRRIARGLGPAAVARPPWYSARAPAMAEPFDDLTPDEQVQLVELLVKLLDGLRSRAGGSDSFDPQSGSGGVGDAADVILVGGDDGVVAADGAFDHGDVHDVVVGGLAGKHPDCACLLFAHSFDVAHGQ
ncbi:MAG: hypothetical protein ACRDZN_00355, partial [Acidimicrobiales bacterium]